VCICTRVSKPFVISKFFISLSSHGSKLHGRMVALVGVVHAMIAVQGTMTAFATNFTMKVLAWSWGSAGQ